MDDSHTGMSMPVNTTLVPLGQAEGTLQVQIVEWEVRDIPTSKESGRKRHHSPCHVLRDRVCAFAKEGGQRVESDPTLGAPAVCRFERGLNGA